MPDRLTHNRFWQVSPRFCCSVEHTSELYQNFTNTSARLSTPLGRINLKTADQFVLNCKTLFPGRELRATKFEAFALTAVVVRVNNRCRVGPDTTGSEPCPQEIRRLCERVGWYRTSRQAGFDRQRAASRRGTLHRFYFAGSCSASRVD